jgi:hypothetical protein
LVEISAFVQSMSPRRADLKACSVVADADGKPWDHHQRRLDVPKLIAAHRAAKISEKETVMLVECMDAKIAARLKVKLSFDWADGKVAAIEIVSVLGAREA